MDLRHTVAFQGMGDSVEACELVVPSLGRCSDDGDCSPKRHCPSPRLSALGRDQAFSAMSSRELYQATQGQDFGTFVGSQMNAIEDEELFIMTQSRILQIMTEARLKQLQLKSNGQI